MKTMVTVFAFAVAATCAQAETFRDRQGHIVGSSSTAATGVTTYRDAQGRQTGTATTDRFGTTTFRDAQGRITGTAARPMRDR